MYKLSSIKTSIGVYESIIRLFDNAQVPINSDNTDYQAYLKWLSEGNEPLPADEGTV